MRLKRRKQQEIPPCLKCCVTQSLIKSNEVIQNHFVCVFAVWEDDRRAGAKRRTGAPSAGRGSVLQTELCFF